MIQMVMECDNATYKKCKRFGVWDTACPNLYG